MRKCRGLRITVWKFIIIELISIKKKRIVEIFFGRLSGRPGAFLWK